MADRYSQYPEMAAQQHPLSQDPCGLARSAAQPGMADACPDLREQETFGVAEANTTANVSEVIHRIVRLRRLMKPTIPEDALDRLLDDIEETTRLLASTVATDIDGIWQKCVLLRDRLMVDFDAASPADNATLALAASTVRDLTRFIRAARPSVLAI